MSARGVTVAVPTLNEAAVIVRVLEELAAGLPTDRPTSIVVADGGSNDGTQALVRMVSERDARVQLSDNPARLQSAAVNLVARMVDVDTAYLIRADAHAGYPPHFVSEVVAALERTGADSVVVPMDSVGEGCIARAIAWVSDSRVGSGGSAHRGGRASGWVDHGHHAGWRVASYLAAGGYDETYSHNEDAELDCRLRRSGGRVWLEAAIRLDYYVRPTFAALWRQYHNYGRGRSRTARRHRGTLRPRQLAVPLFIGLNVMALVAAPRWPATLLLPGTYLAALAAVSLNMALRRRSVCGLGSGPAALVMHVAWATGFLAGMLFTREPRWRDNAGDQVKAYPFPAAVSAGSMEKSPHG